MTKTRPIGTSRVSVLLVRMSQFCLALRRMIVAAPPSMAVCTKRPRCERDSAGRSQSAKPIATRNSTVPPPMSRARRQVSRTPATARTKKASAGRNAGGPPKSLPQAG